MNLVEKMRKARQSEVILVGGIGGPQISLTILRPTDLDMADRPPDGTARAHMEFWTSFVVGWSGITELDLVPGGVGEPVPFDLETFRVWFEDRPQDWETLIDSIRESWTSWHEKNQGEAKN